MSQDMRTRIAAVSPSSPLSGGEVVYDAAGQTQLDGTLAAAASGALFLPMHPLRRTPQRA